mgnify:CR=1 FL=1
MKRNVKLIGLFVICLIFFSGTMAFADDYPTKPVKLIVPWGAGGGTDALMRVIAHFATKYLGQPMVVVNVPGVGGTLGARQGKDAKADGYTLTATHESVISSRIVGVSDFDYSDFIPIANLTLTPAMVAAQPEAPWNDMKDMIAAAKKNPGTIKFGATLGSTNHFFPLDIANQAGIEFKIVGYEGTAKRQAALLGGFIDLGESSYQGVDDERNPYPGGFQQRRGFGAGLGIGRFAHSSDDMGPQPYRVVIEPIHRHPTLRHIRMRIQPIRHQPRLPKTSRRRHHC